MVSSRIALGRCRVGFLPRRSSSSSYRSSIRIAVVNDVGSPHVRRVNRVRSEAAMFTYPEALQRIRIVCDHGLRRNIGMSGIVGMVRSVGCSDRHTGRTALPASCSFFVRLMAGPLAGFALGCSDRTRSRCTSEESCRSGRAAWRSVLPSDSRSISSLSNRRVHIVSGIIQASSS